MVGLRLLNRIVRVHNYKNLDRKLFTSDDIKIRKGKPYGWTYGENVEIHDKQGNVVQVKQKRCDYFGQKETINTVDVAG